MKDRSSKYQIKKINVFFCQRTSAKKILLKTSFKNQRLNRAKPYGSGCVRSKTDIVPIHMSRLAFSMYSFVARQSFSIPEDFPTRSLQSIQPEQWHVTDLLSGVVFSLVMCQGLSILADFPAWPLLAVLREHSYVTGSLTTVVFYFVIIQGLIILADRPACLLLVILPDHGCVTGLLP